MLRALLLDMDGLMADTERLYWQAERAIAARRGQQVDVSTLQAMMGRTPLESMEILRQRAGLVATAEALLAERDALYGEALQREGAQAQPGLMELLDAFEGRLRYAVVTGSSRHFAELILRQLGVTHRLAAIQTCEGVTRGKPDPEIYLKGAALLGEAPADCAVLEDAANGALAGKRAGAYVIGVPTEHSRGQDFSCCDHVASDLRAAAAHLSLLLRG